MTHDIHYNDITRKIIRAARTVHHHLGPGYKERAYSDLLVAEMESLGLVVETGKAVQVTVDDQMRDWLYLDHLVNGLVVVACKAGARMTGDREKTQVMTYLAVTGLPVAILLNFGLPRLEALRVLPPKRPEEWRRYVAPYLRRRW